MLIRVLAGTVALLAMVPAFVSGQDFSEACREYIQSDAVFVARAETAVKRRMSFEEEIDKARADWEAAQAALQVFRTQNLPPSVAGDRDLELQKRLRQAEDHYGRTRAMYPPPMDLLLVPVTVEKSYRGTLPGQLFVQMPGQTLEMLGQTFEPGRSYLVYGTPLLPFAAEIMNVNKRPKAVEDAEAELGFLNQLASDGRGAVVYGSIRLSNPAGGPVPPVPGVPVRLSMDGYSADMISGPDGSFTATGVPPGKLQVEVDLPPHLTLLHVPSHPITIQVPERGCPTLNLLAAVNGRVSGRVVLNDGSPFRGLVELISVAGEPRTALTAFSGPEGEFAFSGVAPGTYFVGINLTRPPGSGAPYPPTYYPGVRDRNEATRIELGTGTEYQGLEWAVGAPLPQGEVEIALDTAGRPQKTLSACITAVDERGRRVGNGAGYERDLANRPIVIPVVEGVRYRVAAMARTSSGYEHSAPIELTGERGRRRLTLSSTVTLDLSKTPALCSIDR